MEINDYQKQISDYADYPGELGPFAIILTLQENVGKLSSKLNDALTKDHGGFTKETGMKCAISLGDILFDVSNIATELGYTMNDVISLNLTKHRIAKERELKKQQEEE